MNGRKVNGLAVFKDLSKHLGDEASMTHGFIDGEYTILVKPMTGMNNSGKVVKKIYEFRLKNTREDRMEAPCESREDSSL